MTMRKAVEVVATLKSRGVIADYAVAGAVAALAYIEPSLTQHLDILVSVADFDERASGIVLLTPIERALAEMGYSERSDVGILVEGWTGQILPVASELDEEALREANEVTYPGPPPFSARVLKPEHLVAKAISIGRLKDLARVEAFLDQGQIDRAALRSVIQRFGLEDAWASFVVKAGRPELRDLG